MSMLPVRLVSTFLFGVLLWGVQAGCEFESDGPCASATEAAGAAIYAVEVSNAVVCLGTRVHPRWVLSAKHCVQPAGESLAAANEVQVRDGDGVARRVTSVEVIGGPYETLGALAGQDLALLELAEASTEPRLELGGLRDDEPDACAMRAEELQTPNRVSVRAVESQAIYTVGVTCGGDSGGPLLTPAGQLVGVASWRTAGDCGSGVSAFTRVDAHLPWVERVLALP